MAAHDFLKRTLDARHIIENYDVQFRTGGTREEKWARHFKGNPNLYKKLCEHAELNWVSRIADIYLTLLADIHKQTLDVDDGTFIKNLTKRLKAGAAWFVKVKTKELYSDAVTIKLVD